MDVQLLACNCHMEGDGQALNYEATIMTALSHETDDDFTH